MSESKAKSGRQENFQPCIPMGSSCQKIKKQFSVHTQLLPDLSFQPSKNLRIRVYQGGEQLFHSIEALIFCTNQFILKNATN